MKALMYIDGQFVESASGRWLSVEDPSTGEVFAEVPDGDSEDVNRAVAAARRAFDSGPWPRMTPEDRRDHLLALSKALAARYDDFVDLVVREAGPPIRMADMMQVAVPLGQIDDFAEHALLLKEPVGFAIDHEPAFAHSEVRRYPIGVCAGFSPYNFPLFMNVWKIAPAVAMGNTVVVKPSPLTPLCGSLLAEACDEVGFPAGVINMVHGDVEPGQTLAAHRGVDRISFTGSTAVGKKIMEAGAGNLKRLTLELGGKSPSVILDDADLDLAVPGSLLGAFIHSGQACVATTRLLVPDSLYDEVVERVHHLVGQMTTGPADDFTTDIGPLISRPQRDKVESFVSSAKAEGASFLTGGSVATGSDLPGGGHYFEPTVVIDADNSMRVAREEVFGPVLTILRYSGRDSEAVEIANDTDYGLAAAVWGGDLARAREVGDRIHAGTVWINDFGAVSSRGPFGGFKQSGIGRELSVEGSLEFTELKHVRTALDPDPDSRSYALMCTEWS